MEHLGTPTTTQGEALAQEVQRLTQERRIALARGLFRSTTVGRQENGLPITKEGLLLEEMIRQERAGAEGGIQ